MTAVEVVPIRIAALPMYEFPELRDAHDRFWTAFHTRLTSQVKIVDWTPSSPCLPFVTSAQTGEATFQALRSAVADVFTDSALAPVRELLLLDGVNLSPDTTLSRVSELEAQAEQWRYPALL